MKKSKLISAMLCGAMVVSMVPQVLSADETDATTEEAEDDRIEITAATFPDTVFRGYVLGYVDTDHDGFLSYDEIDVFEAADMDFIAPDIHDLTGIQYLRRLVSIKASGVQATSLDLSGLDYLEYIMIEDSPLSSVTLDNDRLAAIYFGNTDLSSIDITNCPELRILWILDTNIMVLDATGNDFYSDRLRGSTVLFEGDTFAESHNNAIFYATNIEHVTATSTRSEQVLMANDGIVLRLAGASEEDLPDYEPGSTTETGVGGFVERMYTVALNRASDPVGKAAWVESITSGSNTGADVARGFLFSDEFLNKGYSDVDFVTVLYRTFFDRNPDGAGLASWVHALEDGGATKREVIEGFINSTEFANLCLSYGIACGGTGTPNVEIEPNQQTIDFATRLYTTCLSREADQGGLMAWARQLANQRDTGTGAARGFFFSSEFTSQNVSNAEFVNRLYRTFMGREADEAGFNAWVGQLDSGVSREEVFNGFAQSQEFAGICASYGIIKG